MVAIVFINSNRQSFTLMNVIETLKLLCMLHSDNLDLC